MVTTRLPTLAECLERFLNAMEPDRAPRVQSCQPISGGYSRETAIAEVCWDNGQRERLILRADPPAGTGVFQSDRDDEWQVLQWLRSTGSVPVAPVRYYDAAGDFFGTKCLVIGFVSGRPLQAVAAEAGGQDAATDVFVEAIAGVHATPLDGRPVGLTAPVDHRGYLDGVADSYLLLEREIGDSSPVLRYAADILRSHTPPPVPFTLVHGDCQPGNVLVDGVNRPVVIDWEFARIGDPREDLGYYRQIPLEPNLYTADPAGFLARYRSYTGLTEEQVNPAVVDYFLLVGIARLLSQMIRAADLVGQGRPGGLAAYLINGISLQYDLFLTIGKRLEKSGWEA